MGFDISLGLGLGLHEQRHQKKEDDPFNKANPIISLTLGVGGSPPHASSTCSGQLSSFSNSSTNISIKRERDSEELTHVPAADVENNNINPSKVVVDDVNVDVDEDGITNRKKLRLTKQQSQLLEATFKDHSTLNPKQKQELARKLNLRTRQVEVWFQNRRARTKLKKTEMDCEELKKCYETLTEENKRLEKELKELKSMKTSDAPFNYTELPVAGLTICPSCNRICTGSGGDENNNIGPSPTTTLLLGPKAHIHFYTNNNNYTFTQSFATIAS